MFSTEQNREGIQVGTAIALLVRKAEHQAPAAVRFRDLWGQTKRADLLASRKRFAPKLYEKVTPAAAAGVAVSADGDGAGLPRLAVAVRPVPDLVSRASRRAATTWWWTSTESAW